MLNTVDAWAARTLEEVGAWDDLTPEGKQMRGPVEMSGEPLDGMARPP